MSKDQYQDVPEGKRAELLDQQAYRIEQMPVKRPYSKDELDFFKDEISSKMISIDHEEKKFESVKKEFKEKIEPQKREVREYLNKVRLQYEEKEEKVYLIADYDSGEMLYYDSNGIFLESRRLMPSERQQNVFSINSKIV